MYHNFASESENIDRTKWKSGEYWENSKWAIFEFSLESIITIGIASLRRITRIKFDHQFQQCSEREGETEGVSCREKYTRERIQIAKEWATDNYTFTPIFDCIDTFLCARVTTKKHRQAKRARKCALFAVLRLRMAVSGVDDSKQSTTTTTVGFLLFLCPTMAKIMRACGFAFIHKHHPNQVICHAICSTSTIIFRSRLCFWFIQHHPFPQSTSAWAFGRLFGYNLRLSNTYWARRVRIEFEARAATNSFWLTRFL